MSRAQIAVTGVAAFLILVMLVFPPYFGVDVEWGGTIHASIGHHPAWNPPGSEYVCLALNPEAAEGCRESASAYRSGLNKVRLVLQVVFVLVLMFVVLLVARRREPAS
jgi:hypothetical protein